MNYKMMGRFIARILSIEGIFLLPALAISLYCGETAAVHAFLFTFALIAVISSVVKPYSARDSISSLV